LGRVMASIEDDVIGDVRDGDHPPHTGGEG